MDLQGKSLFSAEIKTLLTQFEEAGIFPPIVRLLGNRIAFIRADVLAWIDSRVASAKGVA